ncbi:NAD(P)/FAD-dependent oxidoreductase [Streptomyces sp. H28]|uniref:flavin-containing monooxygenase n=1 Tax=unclassified Streptomyces TaxID=2593676 RepID=UPI0017838C1F|nr:NAD(P)/FAD-dependent oxidoreductase [Streptomyces sp. H28]MBD9733838.1 NAD(P)/FAD-dependent oxidoreductase [Streptomyces sp. H28]
MEHVDVVVIGGGQSGLAAAHALLRRGLRPVVLEASDRAAGSWPRYYDSLTLFSPARYSSLPGMPFPGADPDHYPHRDEVVAYLTAYANRLDAEIRTGHRVAAVHRTGDSFEVELEGGGWLSARAVVAASGSFGRPHRPALPGLEEFTGQVLHAADYRSPAPFDGRRVVVVGAGNSAVQIAAELAQAARVTLASRRPVKFAAQRLLGRDLHFWLTRTGLDAAPLGRLLPRPPSQPVLDDGRYRAALAAGRPEHRPLFTGADGANLLWPDGAREEVDALVLATGYRPDLPYLARLDGALDSSGSPRHRGGLAVGVPGLAFVGLEWQRGLSSNSLRGVGRDADRIARRLAAHLARS